MKIPKTLKIGGHIVEIDCSEVLPDLNGQALTGENKIKICKNIPQSQKESTLIHEIFHFLNTTFDAPESMTHALIDSLAEQLYQVLSDNNLLVK
jgi:hypothetical protein